MTLLNGFAASTGINMLTGDQLRFQSFDPAGTVAPTSYSWLTPDGSDIRAVGSGISFNLSGTATGGTITRLEVDLGNTGGAPDIIINTAPVALTSLTRLGIDQLNALFSGDDNITGSNTGDDVLKGVAGHDYIYGEGGNDTIYGGAGNDSIFGGIGDNELRGDAGDDVIEELGNDTIFGGDGDDRVVIRNSVTSSSDAYYGGAGRDTIDFSALTSNDRHIDLADGLWRLSRDNTTTVEVMQGFENAIGGSGHDIITGTAEANVLEGNGGADTLEGGEGNDRLFGGLGNDFMDGGTGNDFLDGGEGNNTLIGGLGNDRYVVRTSADLVLDELGFSVGGGIDTVEAWISYTLPRNVEILRLQGNEILSGSGNAAPEALVGNSAQNILNGDGGNDVLNGKAGNDTLIGGNGADSLVGEGGADIFVFNAVTQSRPGAANRDFINGFFRAEGDRIDLLAIDANTNTAGDDAFTFIGNAAFSGVAGQLRFFTFGGGNFNIVEADVNGDRVADMQIFVNLTNTMQESDFIL